LRLPPANCYNVSTMTKLKYILIGLVAIILIVGYFGVHKDQGSDEDQIRAVIEQGQEAIREKSLSKAMSCISPDYKDQAGNDYDRIRVWGMQIFRAEATYTPQVSNVKVTIKGDDAVVTAKVGVKLSGNFDQIVPTRDVTLHLKKEPTQRYLIYHVPMWKVTSMENVVGSIDSGI
jgi:ketosteroid isomerase-like protein